MNETPMGQMEKVIRKWDGDVYAGHEPECWADLRLHARSADARQQLLVDALAGLLGMDVFRVDDPREEIVAAREALKSVEGEAVRAE